MPRTWDYCLDIADRGGEAVDLDGMITTRDDQGWELVSTSMTREQVALTWRRPYVDPRSIHEKPEELI